MHILVFVSPVEILGLFKVLCVGLSIMNMNLLWCYFSTNSRIDWLERIALRWFCTLQKNYSSVLHYIGLWSDSSSHFEGWLYDPIILALLRDCTSESTDPRPHFQALQYRLCSLLLLATLLFLLFLLQKSISTIITMLVSPCIRRTSAPIQFTIVLGVLGTQETLCYLVAGLFERDHLHPTPPTDW